MRISDWSSDVCSSDLAGGSPPRGALPVAPRAQPRPQGRPGAAHREEARGRRDHSAGKHIAPVPGVSVGRDAALGAAVAEQARAKVNLTLQITGRRADGYHTLARPVAFADESGKASGRARVVHYV